MREITIKLTIKEGYDDVHPDLIIADFIYQGRDELFEDVDIEVVKSRVIKNKKEAKGC